MSISNISFLCVGSRSAGVYYAKNSIKHHIGTVNDTGDEPIEFISFYRGIWEKFVDKKELPKDVEIVELYKKELRKPRE